MQSERIHKKLSQAGVASRREIERMIEAGRIEVNQKLATIGQSITPKDRIQIDGKPIQLEFDPPATEILIYHKPVGEIVARKDPEGRTCVFQSIPEPQEGRWVAVGRLDINTSGLLLLTNNGELAHRLMHPSYEISRGYAVRILGDPDESVLRQLRRGVQLEDGPAQFDRVDPAGGEGANRWFHVTLKEGRNREVRRLWEAVELTVSRLSRVHFDTIQLPRDLSRGESRWASQGQVNDLLERVELPSEERKPDSRKAAPRQKVRRNSVAKTSGYRPKDSRNSGNRSEGSVWGKGNRSSNRDEQSAYKQGSRGQNSRQNEHNRDERTRDERKRPDRFEDRPARKSATRPATGPARPSPGRGRDSSESTEKRSSSKSAWGRPEGREREADEDNQTNKSSAERRASNRASGKNLWESSKPRKK